jgi:hypothetical protein
MKEGSGRLEEFEAMVNDSEVPDKVIRDMYVREIWPKVQGKECQN